jgi:16S rRNA (guanine527-N7)-methyltransferase
LSRGWYVRAIRSEEELQAAELVAQEAYRRAGGDPDVLATFVDLVQRTGSRSFKRPQGAWLLAVDSLGAADDERVRTARRMADIGSGAGFPGLVLASLLPQAHVTLIEIRPDRHRFLLDAVGVMGLSNVEVVMARAQEWAEGTGTCDLVTSRNVAKLNTVVELAAPMLVVGGTAILWTRARNPTMESDADAAAMLTGLRREAIRPNGIKSHLCVYAKVAETPPSFPRASGAAFRDPIVAPERREREAPDPGAVSLTPLERQAFELLVGHATFAEMSERLDLPIHAVRREIRRVCRKLGVRSRKQAIASAREYGLFEAASDS